MKAPLLGPVSESSERVEQRGLWEERPGRRRDSPGGEPREENYCRPLMFRTLGFPTMFRTLRYAQVLHPSALSPGTPAPEAQLPRRPPLRCLRLPGWLLQGPAPATSVGKARERHL